MIGSIVHASLAARTMSERRQCPRHTAHRDTHATHPRRQRTRRGLAGLCLSAHSPTALTHGPHAQSACPERHAPACPVVTPIYLPCRSGLGMRQTARASASRAGQVSPRYSPRSRSDQIEIILRAAERNSRKQQQVCNLTCSTIFLVNGNGYVRPRYKGVKRSSPAMFVTGI